MPYSRERNSRQAKVEALKVLGEGVGLDELLARDLGEGHAEPAGLGRLENAQECL